MKFRYFVAAVALVVVLGLLSACDSKPVSESKTNNDEITVQLLFEHDGVKVYRFMDGGRNHYYAVPSSGRSAQTFESEKQGKNSYVSRLIPTLPEAR